MMKFLASIAAVGLVATPVVASTPAKTTKTIVTKGPKSTATTTVTTKVTPNKAVKKTAMKKSMKKTVATAKKG